jgi:hypothetical protein
MAPAIENGVPLPPLDDTDYYGEIEVDGCLHGVPWCEPCIECEWEEDEAWINSGYY